MAGTLIKSLVLPDLHGNRAQFRRLDNTCAVARVTIRNLLVHPSSLRFSETQTFSICSRSIIRRQATHPIRKQTRSVAVRVMPMREQFSEEAIKVLKLSIERASEMGCHYLGTEHLLLGLIHEETVITEKILNSVGKNVILGKIMERRQSSNSLRVAPRDIRFNMFAKQAVLRSLETAHEQDENVKPEHLLLALLQVRGAAKHVLESCGVDRTEIQDQMEESIARESADVDRAGIVTIKQKISNSNEYESEELAEMIEQMLERLVKDFPGNTGMSEDGGKSYITVLELILHEVLETRAKVARLLIAQNVNYGQLTENIGDSLDEIVRKLSQFILRLERYITKGGDMHS